MKRKSAMAGGTDFLNGNHNTPLIKGDVTAAVRLAYTTSENQT